jgi:carbonic anhydrase/acetyltransferase-like protein (isoleucine patch superfamily)
MTRKRLGLRLSAIELLEQRFMFAGDPLAQWQFDSNSGTVLVDSIGTANGTITGSSVYNQTATAQVAVMPVWTASNPIQWGTGTQNGALRLFSDTDGALVDVSVAPQALSVSLWFKADTTNPTRYNSSTGNGGSTNSTSVAMSLFESGDSASGMNIYIYNNRLYVGAWNNAVSGWSSGTFLFSASNAIQAGRWHHVTLTLDPTATLTAGGLRGYLDGTQFGVGNGAAVANTTGIGIGRVDGTTRFLLGTGGSSVVNNDTPASNNHRGFAGYVDEYRVYGETLTADDVTAIRTATAPITPEEDWLIRDSGRAAVIGRFRFAGQLASEHFVFKWGTGLPSSLQAVTTYIQQNLNRLEMSWDIIVEQSGMLAPPARNGVTYKINAYILDTGLWFVDSGGGTFSGAFAGPDPTGFSALYVSPWALAASQNPRSITVAPWGVVANTTTTPHEFMHVLQSESGGFGNSDFSGPFYEAHANFGASLVDNYDTGNNRAEITARNSILGRYGERRHRYSMATDFRYQAHLFLNYLTELPEYGPEFVTGGLWSDPDAQGSGKDPWLVMRNNFASAAEFAQVYADFVASSVTYKALYDGALLSGSPAIPAHNTTTRLYRSFLQPVASSPGWYQVAEEDTPEQYGSNIIKLTPVGRVAGEAHTITVNLDGYVNPGQTSAIYATLVAISGSGAAVVERFSPTWQNGEITFELAANETDVYLTVTAIPSTHRSYIWSHPFYPAGGITQKLERFPYRVAMSGVVPVRSETPVDRLPPSGSAVRHTNPDGSQGGWKTVNVPSTVYLGPNVWVTGGALSGNARIEDYATVVGGTINGNAVVRGNARIQAGTITGNAVVEDYAVVAGGTISEFAHVRGDARINGGQIRGNALVTDYATIMNNATVVAGDTVIKGYGVVDNANMTGNALVMSSGLAAGTGLVTTMGVQYNGEPASQETGLMTTQYNNLFARYLFPSQDNNAIWENFNTTYGWMSDTPATWLSASGIGGLSGVLEFSSDEQYVELSTELSDLRNQTIQLWTRWEGTGDANQKIIEFYRDADNYMHLQPTSTEGGIEFEIAVNGVVRTLRGAVPLMAGEWQHVAVTFAGDTATLYVNGSAVATKTSVTMDPTQVRATSAQLGKGLASAGYRGRVDNLLVYSDARTPAEILTDVRAILGGAYTPAPDADIDHDPGDYNRDGVVNAADYTLWRDLAGGAVTIGALADGNRDGTINDGDYLVWKSHFGIETPPGLGGAGAIAAVDDSRTDVAPTEVAVPGTPVVASSVTSALPPLNLFSAERQSSPGRDAAFASVSKSRPTRLSGAGELATLAEFAAHRHAAVTRDHDFSLLDVSSEQTEGESDDDCSPGGSVPWEQFARQLILQKRR